MLYKTRGIVFRVTDYSERSVVAKIYNERFGLQSYLVNSVRKKNPKIKSTAIQPLTLVDLVVYHKERGGLQRVSDAINMPPLKSIPFDVRKSSIVLFLNEVLLKSVKEEEPNPVLFDFIFNSIHLLDLQNEPHNDFHLVFLVQLTRYLGFFPRENFSESQSVFNLQEGIFQKEIPLHPFYMEEPLSGIFFRLTRTTLSSSGDLKIPLPHRRELVEKLLDYFQLHLSGFRNIQSHKVLEEVWT